jgi:hypothetical protein
MVALASGHAAGLHGAGVMDGEHWRESGSGMNERGSISPGALRLVAAIFGVAGISFIATTVTLFFEFRELGDTSAGWFTIAAVNSHLFLFFPSFGVLALCAFFIPATVFVDLYWHHVPYGRIRFVTGTIVLAVVSLAVSRSLVVADLPAVWWLKPATLASDRGVPKDCDPLANEPALLKSAGGSRPGARSACQRLPVLDALASLRRVSQTRTGLSPFVRNCSTDPYIEMPPDLGVQRFCFASGQNMTASQCCVAQSQFRDDLSALYAREGQHSMTGSVHAAVLPLKVMFLLIVLCIGVMLALWRRTVDRVYSAYAKRIERGIIVGAIAMMLWPISNHAFLQSSAALYGRSGQGVYTDLSSLISLAFGAWALLLVLFFFRQHERDVEAAGKIAGAIVSAVAVFKYNEIIDYSVRYVGAGSHPLEIAILGAILLGAFVALVWGARITETVRVPKLPPEQPYS